MAPQALSRKPADDVAVQTLQIWLLGAQKDLICQFLDALEIPHDGKGLLINSRRSHPAKS